MMPVEQRSQEAAAVTGSSGGGRSRNESLVAGSGRRARDPGGVTGCCGLVACKYFLCFYNFVFLVS